MPQLADYLRYPSRAPPSFQAVSAADLLQGAGRRPHALGRGAVPHGPGCVALHVLSVLVEACRAARAEAPRQVAAALGKARGKHRAWGGAVAVRHRLERKRMVSP